MAPKNATAPSPAPLIVRADLTLTTPPTKEPATRLHFRFVDGDRELELHVPPTGTDFSNVASNFAHSMTERANLENEKLRLEIVAAKKNAEMFGGADPLGHKRELAARVREELDAFALSGHWGDAPSVKNLLKRLRKIVES